MIVAAATKGLSAEITVARSGWGRPVLGTFLLTLFQQPWLKCLAGRTPPCGPDGSAG